MINYYNTCCRDNSSLNDAAPKWISDVLLLFLFFKLFFIIMMNAYDVVCFLWDASE